MSNKDSKKGKTSLETLSHFQCGKCSKWWSIGDASIDKKEWYCPWCGELQEFISEANSKSQIPNHKPRQ